MESTTTVVKTTNNPLKDKRVIIGLIVGAVILLLLVIGLLVAAASGNTPNNTAQNTNNTTNQTNNDNGGFLPAQTCPDELSFEGGATAIYDGKEYNLREEDITWIDANCRDNNSNNSSQGAIPNFSHPECTGNGSVAYTDALMNLNDLGNITPLGRMFDSHVTPTDHQYWQPVDRNASYHQYNIYSPADGFIIAIGRTLPGVVTTVDQAVTSSETEYRIVIEHSCDFYTILTHMHSLSDEILNQVSFDSSNNVGMIRIPVEGGELISTVGANSFDITTVDVEKRLTGFVNEETYEGEPWKIYTADSIAYFNEPLKSQYYDKVSRSVEPISGKIDYDKDGYAIGNWFRKDTGGYSANYVERYWDGHLAIAPNQHNPEFMMFSTGHFIDGKSAQFIIDPNTPDPENVSASSGIVVYNLYKFYYARPNGNVWNDTSVAKDLTLVKDGAIRGKLLLEVQADKTLKVELVAGSSSQTTFSGAAQIYTR